MRKPVCQVAGSSTCHRQQSKFTPAPRRRRLATARCEPSIRMRRFHSVCSMRVRSRSPSLIFFPSNRLSHLTSSMASQSPDMDIPKHYEPHDAFDRWYAWWEERGYFNADPNPSKPPHAIMIPLPNVTGALHMGHALNGTLQD